MVIGDSKRADIHNNAKPQRPTHKLRPLFAGDFSYGQRPGQKKGLNEDESIWPGLHQNALHKRIGLVRLPGCEQIDCEKEVKPAHTNEGDRFRQHEIAWLQLRLITMWQHSVFTQFPIFPTTEVEYEYEYEHDFIITNP